MPIVQAVNISRSFGADPVLSSATLSIEPGERIGLVGRNGTGKSTLLRIIAGDLALDSGDVQTLRGSRVGYLKQDPDLPEDDTLRDAAESAFDDLHRLHAELHEVFEKMASASDDDLTQLLHQQERLEREIDAAGGYAIDHTIDATLHGLGFTNSQFSIKCKDLSGGQRSRLSLAILLLENPDLLLLDEPTNHLDIPGRIWLEEFLRDQYRGAVLMVSHDRRMLDNVVHRIVEVEDGRLIDYPGAYEAFRKLRKERRITQRRAWEKQQTTFRQQEQFISRYKTGQRAKEAKGRQKKLDRAREAGLDRPLDADTLQLRLPKAPRSSDVVVKAKEVGKRYTNVVQNGEPASEKILFHDLDLTISRGERWGIIGPNGAGKTTLIRCLLDEIPLTSGMIKLGSNIVVGHYRQQHDVIDPDQQLYRFLQDIIRRENPGKELSEQQARDLAGAFLFSGAEQDKEMRVLSGGERARVMLAGLLASAKNLLILDEPTNHLDIPSSERLEEVFTIEGGYAGTLILISHDRALLDAMCDHLIVLDGEGGAEVFLGNFTDWRTRENTRLAEAKQVEQAHAYAKQKAASVDRQPQSKSTNSETNEQRTQRKEQAKLARLRTEQLESRIEEIESRLREIDASLSDPDVWRDHKKASALGEERTTLAAQLEPLEFEWSRRAEKT